MHNLLRCILAFMLLCTAVSCGTPAEESSFVRQSDRDSSGKYAFKVSLDDSLHRHTLEIYTMIDAPEKAFGSMPGMIPLHIEAIAPSGKRYAETVGIPKDSCTIENSFSRQYGSVYRQGFVPSEYGEWTIQIKVVGEDRFPGLRGLGLKHTEK